MQTIYEGMPELFKYIIGLVKRRPHRDAQSIVSFNLLREILLATEHAIVHYFALTLSEPFLQNSQHGSPYQKWAMVTNDNFQNVDNYVKALIPVIEHFLCPQTIFENPDDDFKTICVLLYRIKNEYTCCEVNQNEPLLTVSAIHLDDWLDTASGKYYPLPRRENKLNPEVVLKSVVPIADRSKLKKLQSTGIMQVEELRSLLLRFAAWLEANYSLSDFTVVPAKDLFVYKHWLVDTD
jgi:hypothetical protein